MQSELKGEDGTRANMYSVMASAFDRVEDTDKVRRREAIRKRDDGF